MSEIDGLPLVLSASLVLIPLLPLIASLWIATGFVFFFNRDESGERQTAFVSIGSISISLLLIMVIDFYLAFIIQNSQTISLGPWLSAGKYSVDFNFILDYKSLVMATLTGVIALLITRFSVIYLHRESGFQRFFLVLNLFTSAMLFMAFAGNAVLMFMAWEIAGVSSFLLIAYSWNRNVATRNATRAFISNRIGDAGFIFGIAFSYFWLGSVDWQTLAITTGSKIHIGIILFGFLVAAFAKSAQLPFTAWITRALEGPTPSSAIFYGSLMVHAGVYLLLRLEPLLVQVPTLQFLILLIGFLTFIYAYIVGFVQTDIKSSFIFSTLSQVALMFIWIGLGWFHLALVHLVMHAIWRAYQFLHAPSFMQLVSTPAPAAPGWLNRKNGLYTAALNRFWLDGITDWLLTRPTQLLAREIQVFDEQVVDRITGVPTHSTNINKAVLDKQGKSNNLHDEVVGTGKGFFGKSLEYLANTFQYFEEHLILHGSGEGLLKGINFLGKYLEVADKVLMQPRYILVIIMATFVVVL